MGVNSGKGRERKRGDHDHVHRTSLVFPALEGERGEQAREAQTVVRVQMRYENDLQAREFHPWTVQDLLLSACVREGGHERSC